MERVIYVNSQTDGRAIDHFYAGRAVNGHPLIGRPWAVKLKL